MLVENLKSLVADLFKQSEDAVPVLGDGDKKEWMACHLEDILDEDGDALQCLQKFDLISEVIDYLEKEYKVRNDKNHDPSLLCETQLEEKNKKISGVKQEQRKQGSKTIINKAKEKGEASKTIAEEKQPAKSGKKGSVAKSSPQNKKQKKTSPKSKKQDNDSVLIIEEIIIVKDEGCGC